MTQLIQLTAEAIAQAFAENLSCADATLARYISSKHLGKIDRQMVSDLFYGVIRFKKSLEYLCQSQTLGVLVNYYHDCGKSSEDKQLALWEACQKKDASLDTLYNIPQWMLPVLQEVIPDISEQAAFMKSLNQTASIDIRVNTLKTTPEKLMAYFAAKDISVQKTDWAPHCLRFQEKTSFRSAQDLSFQQGHFEIQDEGSQLISHWCQTKRQETVLDLCAGAGGKSLALSALMKNTGRIYATDISRTRLEKIKPRITRSGSKNIIPITLNIHDDSSTLKKLYGKIDRVLIDAPCSGSGTWRRHPYLRWCFDSTRFQELQRTQLSILETAIPLIRKGGWLIYSTCSFLPNENQKVIDRFLLKHPDFYRLPYSEWNACVIDRSQCGKDAQLYTHLHQTDCFFTSILIKKN